MGRPGFPDAETFVRIWQRSVSAEAASARLVRCGYYMMTEKVTRRWAKTLRELDVPLKKANPPLAL